jgi:Cd2+/Zn2+-exporting ATPase
MIVRRGDRYLGVIGLMDTPREAAKATIAQLRDIGIERMIMISGDNHRVTVAEAAGIDQARGDLVPGDKVEAIKQIRRESKVATANAAVGIAMGAARSDLALETADVALMADDLRRLPFAVGLSCKTA